MLKDTILIGCDPELFVKDSKTGHHVSAHGMVPGTKAAPYKVDKGAVQVDGMALEFNIDPASTADEFVSNIETVMRQLRDMVPKEYEFDLVPSVTFSKAHFDLQPDEAKELGCEPDYNAYTMQENRRPNAESLMRTASGHVHIGFTEDADVGSADHMLTCATLVKQLDLWLGLPSMVFDTDQTRRQMYGQAGAFRPKLYGCEYRVLSNKWLSHPDLMRWVFNQTVAAVENLKENKGNVLFPYAKAYMVGGYPVDYIKQTVGNYTGHLLNNKIFSAPEVK